MSTLDEAWAAVEAALPEFRRRYMATDPDGDRDDQAGEIGLRVIGPIASLPLWTAEVVDWVTSDEAIVEANADTPAAALLALAAKLREDPR